MRSATSCAAAPYGDVVLPDDRRQVVDVLDRQPADPLPHLCGIGVDQRDRLEPPLGEPPVVRQGVPQVPDPRDHDRPVLGEPELAPNLVDQVGDVVPHTARPVRTQVRQVLADLGGVDAGRLGERLGRDRDRPRFGHLEQHAEIDRQAAHGGLGDGALSHAPRRSGGIADHASAIVKA
jgi:hypothetical protein